MIVQLPPDVAALIHRESEVGYPREVCGLLLGRLEADVAQVLRAQPVPNTTDDDARRRYTIAPEALFEWQRRARDEGLIVLGAYHSHPDHSARPSRFDVEQAWPEYLYLICEVHRGLARTLRAWRLWLDGQPFAELALRVTEPARWDRAR